MHIVFFTMGLNRGGSERVIVNLCNECLVKDHEISIITCLSDEAMYDLNIKIRHMKIDSNESERRQKKVWRFYRRRKVFKKIMKKIHPDIIISFLPEPSFIALSLKKDLRIPIIVSERWDPILEYHSAIYQLLIKILYPNGDGFVFQTEDAKNYFDKNTQMKSVIIPNPLTTDVIRERYTGVRKKEVVTVGRLAPEKNHQMLLYAWKKIAEEFPEYVLRIYGEGSLRAELEVLTKQLRLEERVFFMGVKDNVFEFICQSALFVLSSTHEGMPNALMEAMALGLPVISTNCPCGGPSFLIENGYNGILVENDNINAMAEGIRCVLSDREFAEKISRNARKIVEKLEPEKINKQWEDYICKIYQKGV